MISAVSADCRMTYCSCMQSNWFTTACGPKVCHNGSGANARFVFLPVKFSHRKQHYFNKIAYLTFLNFVINPFCAITEQICRGMDA